ncbi:MAG: transposase family protein [Chloroflexota bacterium]
MAENGSVGELTPRQQRTIAALLQARNVSDAARMAGVGERTLYRWMGDPLFRAALASAEGDAIDQATRRLVGLQDGAIDLLQAMLEDPTAAAAVRLRAAQSVLDYLLKLRELRDVEARLAALEKAVLDDYR